MMLATIRRRKDGAAYVGGPAGFGSGDFVDVDGSRFDMSDAEAIAHVLLTESPSEALEIHAEPYPRFV